MTVKFTEVVRERMVEMAQKTLWEENSPDVDEARSYLQKTREISDEILKQYRFGYVPKRARHDWSERIVMPLYDPYENLIVLTSRKFRSKDAYTHLHEVFDKRYYLYGLDIAKMDILHRNKAIIVEGQFDTAYLRSRGFKTVVGVLGSAFTFEHACILRRYCSEIYLLFDGDDAGRDTLERSLLMLREERLSETFGMTFIPASLPKDDDPDDFVRKKGPGALVDLLNDAKIERNQFSMREH